MSDSVEKKDTRGFKLSANLAVWVVRLLYSLACLLLSHTFIPPVVWFRLGTALTVLGLMLLFWFVVVQVLRIVSIIYSGISVRREIRTDITIAERSALPDAPAPLDPVSIDDQRVRGGAQQDRGTYRWLSRLSEALSSKYLVARIQRNA